MKIGPLEILVILIAVFAAGLMFRLFRGDRSVDERSTNNSVAVSTGQELARGNNRVRKAGVVLVVLGAILLLLGMSTFEFVMKMFLWAFILVGAGLLALFLSRNR
jgi:hypothetical protein